MFINRIGSNLTVPKQHFGNINKQTSNSYNENNNNIKENLIGTYRPLAPISEEEFFDERLISGVKLKNGSTLIRPVILSLGKVRITPTADGIFNITSSVSDKTLTMTEQELVNTKWISRGSIKRVDENTYFLNYTDKYGEEHIDKADKKEAMEVLKRNFYYL